MDLQTLTNLFATTYNPDPNIRKSAELQIRKIANEEGVIGALLQIIANGSIEAATRQACAVWLKNRVYKTYALETDRRPDQPFIGNTDRDSLRGSILHLLATSPSRAITTQLGAALKTIIAHDFPEKWPGLIPQIKQLLQSNSVQEVHAGCIAALEAIRAFKFRQTTDVLPGIISELFPILVSIATQMAGQTPTAAQEIPTMLHLILKTYKSSITVNLSAHQQSAESIVPWGKLFFAIVNLQLPAESVPADEEGRERSEWWQTKKWAYAILGRLFHRFGNPSQLPSTMQKEYGTFAAHFVDQFAPEILSTYLKQVNLFVSKQAWLSKKCQYHIFTFFTACVKPKSTWVLLKPHAQTLVSTFVFSQLTFNEERKELWNTDPVDYVRVSVDEYENYSSPVAAATTFLLSLATNRTKITFMPILAFVNQVLRSNASPQERFGALNMVAALGTHIMSHPEVKTEMEQFILSFVTPALSSSEPYLRAIALEILGTVVKHGLQWSNPQQLMSHSQAAAQALDDSEFPVQVQGALALTEMVTAYDDVRQAVAPQVGKVVHALVKMSDDTDLSVVNSAMEVIVEQYQVELLPVAAELVAHLCATYMRYVQEIASKEADVDPTQIEFDDISGDDNDKSFSAMGVAKTILTVVDSIEESKEILAQVQEIIVPVLVFTLEHKLIDLFDYVYELTDSLTFHSRAIAPSMWRIFELTYSAFKTDAVDFLEEMLPTLDNFISYGSETIKGNNDYKKMLVDIYTASLTVEHLGENDKVNGSKLAESILLNLRGSVDDYLHIIINAALSLLDQPVTQALRLANLEVLVNSVLYNPVAALHIMETKQAGTARKFFDLWFAAINGENKLPRVHDKKLSILTLSALMEVPAANVPDSLRDGWPGIVGGALRLFKDLPKAVEVRKALQAEYDAGEEIDDTYAEKLLNFNDEEGDVWDDESAYLEMLANESARLRAKSERQGGDGSTADSDSDEEEELIEEELTYISPIETVDAYTTFKRALTTLQLQNGPAYQAATTALDVDQQTLLMEVMRIADATAAASA